MRVLVCVLVRNG